MKWVGVRGKGWDGPPQTKTFESNYTNELCCIPSFVVRRREVGWVWLSVDAVGLELSCELFPHSVQLLHNLQSKQQDKTMIRGTLIVVVGGTGA